MIELKTAEEINKMAVTGEFVAETLATLSIEAQPGVNLMQLEHHARTLITDRGAKSRYWDYAPSFGRGPFRNVICLSVNDAVLTVIVGDTADAADRVLIESTQRALDAGIAAAGPGGRLGDISSAIGGV